MGNQDIHHQLMNQIDEDEEEQEQVADLMQRLVNREYEMKYKRYENFQRRREQRMLENRSLPLESDEMVADAEERLAEIRAGDCCQPGYGGRPFQFVDPDFPHSAE